MSDSSAFAPVSDSYTTTVPFAWLDENDLENQIFTLVSEKGNHDLNFTGVPPDIGQALFDFLDERISARIKSLE
ncbi:hypothetical protein N7509_005255 [Penicillium cosmopolitanum]|uniref:Uncharacterized protein n=1 Tax=Penicillium cosmopolitanum TaxID=1131564 RepID=A0A9X0B9X6_9EURO|nr:uncharacterized protein N7509_005255 [Penicillium cosmopolitanum]KAJ5397142.1 hypothetical protein N7509_005255 [Penicillium cosmopolitanum]